MEKEKSKHQFTNNFKISIPNYQTSHKPVALVLEILSL